MNYSSFSDEFTKIAAARPMINHYEVTLDEDGKASGLSDAIHTLAGLPTGARTVRVQADEDLEKTASAKSSVRNSIKKCASMIKYTKPKRGLK